VLSRIKNTIDIDAACQYEKLGFLYFQRKESRGLHTPLYFKRNNEVHEIKKAGKCRKKHSISEAFFLSMLVIQIGRILSWSVSFLARTKNYK